MGAGQSMEVERALDEAPTAQAAAKVLGALEPGALAEALRDQGVRDGPDLLSRLEALPNNKDVAPVDNFLDRLRTIRAACVRVEAKGQQLRGTKQDLDDLDQKKNSNADDLLYATRVDLAAQLATLEQHAVKLRHMEKMLLLERLEGAKGLESPRAIGKMPPHLPMKEAERLNDTRRREAKAYTAKSPTVRFEDGFAGVERDKFGSPVLKKRPMSPFEEHFGPEIAKDEGEDASPRTLARCMTARAATRAQQLIVQHEAAKPDPVAVAKQDEEQSCASIEEVFERFCGLYRLEHMTNTIFAKFCRDTKGVVLCENQNFTARSCCIAASSSTPSTRRLLDGVAVWVSHPSTEPARPRRRREMHPTHWLISTQSSTEGLPTTQPSPPLKETFSKR